MLKNYLNSAFRNLWKHKLYSSINIGGLSLGLTVAVLILLYVKNELSYDTWLPDKDQLYRVYRFWPESGGATVWTPDPLAEQLSADFPEIIEGTGLSSYGETMLEYENNKFFIEDIAMVDSTFFEVLDLPLKYGQKSGILEAPNAVVLSERVAGLFFGSEDPVGKTLRFNDELDLVVTGVIRPLKNTHLPYEVYTRYTWENPNWNSNNRATYIKVNDQTNIAALQEKITEHVNNFKIEEWSGLNVKPTAEELPDWNLQPVADIHLHSANIGSFSNKAGDIKYVYIFGMIALIVLLIGAINYINLSTARALGRAREVGVRKVTGARREQLIGQFLMETVTQALLALFIAVFLVELFLPGFNQIVDRELHFLGGDWVSWILPMLGLSVMVGLLAGMYPAFVMSSFKPVKVLKSLQKGKGGASFRRALVVTQFSLSVVLVIVMLFIYKQINFMMNQDLGFKGDQIVVVPFNADDGYRKFKGMEEQFKNIPGLINTTSASRMPGHGYPDWSLEIQGRDDLTYPRVLFTDESYMDVLELELADGRYFSTEFPGDTARTYVVNEAFIREYNVEDPFSAKIKFSGEEEYSRIIGVVKDYHYRALDRRIQPLLIGLGRDNNYAGIQVSATDLSSTLTAIEQLWASVEPAHPIRYSFLNEDFGSLYEEYRRFGQALLYATFLAIFVAILGLFGLATYSTITRTKEIGVRKVLGASVQQLSFMLVGGFIKWVLLSGLIAAPIGYFISSQWLQDFAYRTELSALPFIGAIGFSILIAALTVSFQAIWSARRNPVEALRYE